MANVQVSPTMNQLDSKGTNDLASLTGITVVLMQVFSELHLKNCYGVWIYFMILFICHDVFVHFSINH